MRPWSADRPPPSEDAYPRRPSAGFMREQEPMEKVPPLFFDAPGARAASPRPRGVSRPIERNTQGSVMGSPSPSGEHPPEDAISPLSVDVTKPLIASGRFAVATGMGLKIRFLLALTLLSLAPAFLLVLIFQEVNQNALEAAGQQALYSTAEADSQSLTNVLSGRQATLARVAQQNSVAAASQGTAGAEVLGQAENLLSNASLSTGDALAWMVLTGNDQITASSPKSLEGHMLANITLLQQPAALENFVQAQRTAKPGQGSLAVTSGQDSAIPEKVWVAMLAFVSPTSPAQSGAVLAVFSLPALANASLITFRDSSSSFAALVDTQGLLLGVAGNKTLEAQLGTQISTPLLEGALHSLQSGGDLSTTAQFSTDPATGTEEEVSGAMLPDIKWGVLVVAPAEMVTPSQPGVLSLRNIPLVFLSIVVVTTLIATWVAIPIVRPIRRASREILSSTEEVRGLAEQAKKIAKDQQIGTDILTGAANGLDMRRRAIGRDANLIVNSSTNAATRLAQLAHLITQAPDPIQGPMQLLSRELYQELQSTHQLATGISTSLESDPVQKRLGAVMEGAAEISQQFEQASQQLERGAVRLGHAAETLQ